jgi:cytochrome c biogenesis protein CcmG/thiol:disulfide interchange protein DsbE
MRKVLLWLPLAAFVAVLATVASGLLRPADPYVRSALVGHELPRFDLPAMVEGAPGVSTRSFTDGTPKLLNVFASWCIPCIAESPQLMKLKQMGVPIEGVAVRDTPENIAEFLDRYGNPYVAIGDDRAGQLQLAIGSSGVPESYVIDGEGRIVLQHIGDIRADDVARIAEAVRDAR